MDLIERRIQELEGKLDEVAHALRHAVAYRDNDPNSSLNKTRTVLEKLILDAYRKECKAEPKRPEIGSMLNDQRFSRSIERRILSRIHSVRDMGNIGTHGEIVNGQDAHLALMNLCDIIDWYFERYAQAEGQLTHDPKVIPSAHHEWRLAKNPSAFIGCTLGKYRLHQVLGSGGSGVCFRASRLDLRITSAVKILHPPPPAIDDALHARMREALRKGIFALSKLDHPNIPKIYDFDSVTIDGRTVSLIGMEYVKGRNLDAWIASLSFSPEDLSRRFLVCKKLISALDAAHTCPYADELGFQHTGITHGDIKPANILIRDDDEPKLVDFMMDNLQQHQDPAVLALNSNECWTMAFGTKGFMPPEQENDGVLSPLADIYALGITLGILFRGVPYSPATNHLTRVLNQMTEAQPEKRPQSAQCVSDLLFPPATHFLSRLKKLIFRKSRDSANPNH